VCHGFICHQTPLVEVEFYVVTVVNAPAVHSGTQ
jgi:hypothetical protein